MKKTDSFNVGIIGAGHIAGIMAKTLRYMKGVNCCAIASRDISKAKKFASAYRVPVAYGSYEELVKDEKLDLIYIATLNPFHKENALLCLKYKKPVLIEKPFCMNLEETMEVLDYAKKQDTFVAEATLIRYSSLGEYILKIINEGAIGEVKYIHANLGFNSLGVDRIANAKMGGGALYDLGVYLLHFTEMIYKDFPRKLIFNTSCNNDGIDIQNEIIQEFENGKKAILFCAVDVTCDNTATIIGTKGKIVVNDIFNFSKVRVYIAGGKKYVKKRPRKKCGYEDEIIKCMDTIKTKKIEIEMLPWNSIISVMKQMDEIRNK